MATKETKFPETPPPTYEEACIPGFVDPAPPLQPGYPAVFQVQGGPQAMPPSTMIVQNNFSMPQFGSSPVRMTCPICNSMIITRTKAQPGTISYIAAIMLCFFFWPLACAPFCMCQEWHDVVHRCPNCKTILGIKRGGF